MPLIELQHTPSIWHQYGRALLSFRRGHSPHQSHPRLPNVVIQQSVAAPDNESIKPFCELCHTPPSDYLPMTYPHLLAFPLHMELLLHPDFPFPLPGLIHITNRIVQHQPVPLNARLNIQCRFGDLIESHKGLEFDIETNVKAGETTLWESTSTNLYRGHASPHQHSAIHTVKTDKQATGQTTKAPFNGCVNTSPQQIQHWTIPEQTGRHYAALSGDCNPIHLHRLSARLFGFPRAIAHGMWHLANALGHLDSLIPANRGYIVTTVFKKPIFLPSTVQFQYTCPPDKQRIDFVIKNQSGVIPHQESAIDIMT